MRKPIVFFLLFFLALSIFPRNYEEEILAWRKNRLARLTAADGWVTLAGLFWLQPGENSLGSGSENGLRVHNTEFPEKAGVFEVGDGRVLFRAQAGVEVFCEEKKIDSLELVSDLKGRPTLLRSGAFSWHLIQRGELLGVRLRWADHPNRVKLKEIPAFPVDPAWRIKARFLPYEKPKKVLVPSVIGTSSEEECPGEIHLEIKGEAVILYPTGSRESLGLLFGDAGNGRESYIGGRFLPLGKPNEKNEIILDFNLAYSPPCAFTPFATCPMVLPENILPLPVTAGEKEAGPFEH